MVDSYPLDPSCPVSPLLPYVLRFNASAATGWVEQEAHALEASLEGSLPVAIALTVGSLLLLLAGERLSRLAFFLSAGVVAYLATLLATDAALSGLSLASAAANCVALCAAPLLVGVAVGGLALRLLTLAFASVGLCAGGALGFWSYELGLHRVATGIVFLHRDLTYFICIGVAGLVGAVLLAHQQKPLMVFATAAAGAVGLVPGLALLAFSRFDARFLWVVDPSAASEHRGSPFVWGQCLSTLLYFAVGVAVQRRLSGAEGRSCCGRRRVSDASWVGGGGQLRVVLMDGRVTTEQVCEPP